MKISLPIKRIDIILLVFVLLLAFLLRFLLFKDFLRDLVLYGDQINYHMMSHQLVDRGVYGYGFSGMASGYPNAFVTPGYPLILSFVYFIFRDKYLQITIVRLGQVIVGSLSILFVFLLVKRLVKRTDVALLTSFFAAIYPTYTKSVILLLTEVFSLASMLLYFYLTALGFQEKKSWLNVLAGIAFAVHILIRPAMIPLFILPFVYCFFESYKNDRKTLFKFFLQTLAGFTVCMLPWWIRNIIVMNSFILTATGLGNPLLGGTYPYMQDLFYDVTKEIARNGDLQAQLAIERIIRGFTSQPLLYLKWYTIGKTQLMFQKAWLVNGFAGSQIPHKVIHGFYIWAGCAGIIINSITSKVHRYINLYLLAFLGIYLVFIPSERYVYQHMLFLMFAAAYLICKGFERILWGIGKNRTV